MGRLEDIRRELAAIDQALVENFLRRMHIVDQVADYKESTKGKVHLPEQERRVIERGQSQLPPELQSYGRVFLETLIRLSRERQYERLIEKDDTWQLGKALREADSQQGQVGKVVISGELTEASACAARGLYPGAALAQAGSLDDACRQVVNGLADRAVLPLQEEVCFLLEKHALFIQSCSKTSGGPVVAVGRELILPIGQGVVSLLIHTARGKEFPLVLQVLNDLNLPVVQIQFLPGFCYCLDFLASPDSPVILRALYQVAQETVGLCLLGWYV